MTVAAIKLMESYDEQANPLVVLAKKEATDVGVTFSPVTGARCPNCRAPRGNVYRTLKWQGGNRLRYHCCRRCGQRFKSVESIETVKRNLRKKALN